jgi:hypothetical protein
MASASRQRPLRKKPIKANLAIAEDSDRYRRLREIDSGEAYGQQWAHVPADQCLDLQTLEPPKPSEETAAGPVEYVGPAQSGLATVSPARW